MYPFRQLLLYVVRSLGGFRLCEFLTRRQLRILCYHGFSVGDEFEVMPQMFMRASTFERRMETIKRRKIPVVSLDEGVKALRAGAIHHGEVVITLDDGWASNLTIAAPILERNAFPATIYLTTEHLSAGSEVFNVALAYMIERSPLPALELYGLHPRLDGSYPLRENSQKLTEQLIIAAEEAYPSLADRQALLRPIAAALLLDPIAIFSGERFRLLNSNQIRQMPTRGLDLQLHTHSHRLPDDDFDAMAASIAQNRAALNAIVAGAKLHFCFPSGRYNADHPKWLSRLGIASATTCDPGLNCRNTSPWLLKRYLDRDDVSDIYFEAEICGLREIARNIRRILTSVRGAGAISTRKRLDVGM